MEEKILNVQNLDFLRISMLYNDIKRGIEVFKDRITDAIKKKGEKYKQQLSKIQIAISKQYFSFIFIFDPIEGYNKTYHHIVVTYDNEEANLVYLACNCDGYKKNKVCSHLYGLYLWLEERY